MAVGVAESGMAGKPMLPPIRPAEKMPQEAVAGMQKLGEAVSRLLPQLEKMADMGKQYSEAIDDVNKRRLFGQKAAETRFEKVMADTIAEMGRTREAVVEFNKSAGIVFTEKAGVFDEATKSVLPTGATTDRGLLGLLPKDRFSEEDTVSVLMRLGAMTHDMRFPPDKASSIIIYSTNRDLVSDLAKIKALCDEAKT